MKELFVGYLPTMPPGIARLIRRAVAGLLLVAALAAVALVRSQHRFAASGFEYNTIRDFEGMVEERPYPALLVARPGIQDAGYQFSRYVLVGTRKHGADKDIAGFDGKNVKLRGKLIYRGDETLIEVMPGTVSENPSERKLYVPMGAVGAVTVTGEIVDSKCYFGVMNPGEGKVHRDCATRCLSGGIPPALITGDPEGHVDVYLLANADGGRVPPSWAAARAARPVSISGRLVKSGDTLILQADLSSFRFVQ
jgi:hypothetical protein